MTYTPLGQLPQGAMPYCTEKSYSGWNFIICRQKDDSTAQPFFGDMLFLGWGLQKALFKRKMTSISQRFFVKNPIFISA